MAWIALIFYCFDSIYQWLTSDLIGWQRGEGGEVLINFFCMHGFEIHPCRLVFKNSWTEFGKHKNWYLPNFLNNSPKNLSDHKKWVKKGSQTIGIHLSRLLKQLNVEKFQFVHKENWMANVISFFFWNPSRHGNLKKFRLLFWPFFHKNYRFSLEAIQNQVSLIFLFWMHGFEIHPCRLVFKNSWTEFGKHKTNIYLIFIKTHQKICQITKIWCTNRLANPWSLSKQFSQATKRWKTLRLFLKKIEWPLLYVFLLKPFKARIFEKLEVTFSTNFFHKQLSFLSGSNIKLGFP